MSKLKIIFIIFLFIEQFYNLKKIIKNSKYIKIGNKKFHKN